MAKVLLVEDEVTVRKMLARMLQRSGHDVTTARNGSDARALLNLKQPAFEVIVSDIDMPNGSGIDLLRFAAGVIPVVLMSAGSAAVATDDPIVRDAAALISKPFRFNELLDVIARIVS